MKLIYFFTLTAWAILPSARLRAQEGPAPLEDAEQKKLIADVTARALQYSKELPEFVCTQVTRKNEDPTGTSHRWKLTDTIHEEVTFRGNKEEYREVSLNGKKIDGESRHGDLISTASFAEAISFVFDPKYHATFQWAKWDSLRGHRVHEIAWAIKLEDSPLAVGKKQVKTALLGVVDADADTGAVLRIMMIANGLTKNSPLQALTREFHYDFAKIGDHYYLLPLKADIQSRDGKKVMWDEYEFRDYRKP